MKLKQARQFQSKSGKLISFKWKWQSGDLKKSRHKKVASSPHLKKEWARRFRIKKLQLEKFEWKKHFWKLTFLEWKIWLLATFEWKSSQLDSYEWQRGKLDSFKRKRQTGQFWMKNYFVSFPFYARFLG